KYRGLALNIPGPASWIESTSRFWYRKSVQGGNEFVLVDANTLARRPAFDHEKLAASLSAASGQSYKAVTLPFSELTFIEDEKVLRFAAAGSFWKCELSSYACEKTGAAPRGASGATVPADESPAEFGNDVSDGISELAPQQAQGARLDTPEPAVIVSPDGK